ncbi:unnamed protein product [Choristocarpus tenellus]
MEPLGVEGGPSRSMLKFRGYEESYHNCSRSINNHINQLGLPGGGWAVGASEDVAEAEQLVKEMEVEARSMKGSEQRESQSRVNQCRADLKSLRRSLDEALQRAKAEELRKGRRGTRGGGYNGNNSEYANNVWSTGAGLRQGHIEGLQAAQESLDRSRLTLLDSQRVLEETEVIGQGVATDLESQRESLLRSRSNVRGTSSVVQNARQELVSLSRKDLLHRLCLYLVIIALSCAILWVLYHKIRRRVG